jgi:CheY-like chemotaxis protein
VRGYEFLHLPEDKRLAEHVALENARAVIRNAPPDRAGQPDQPVSRLGGAPVIECALPSHAWVTSDLAVTACLTKPITLEQLTRAVGQLDRCSEALIVDDDRGFGELVERMLIASGMVRDVRHAYDGQQALRAIMERRPDVILTDLAMPVMDGFEMLSRLRHMPEASGVPVIVLTVTSYAEDALRHHAGRLTVTRDTGFQPFETLRCLQSLLDGLCAMPAQPSNHTHLSQRAQHIVSSDGLEQAARGPE